MGNDPGTLKEPVTLYEGPVRALCPLAPNNVNTMAVAAICAHNLGFDGVVGRLVADPSMTDRHVVEIEARSKLNMAATSSSDADELVVKTSRSNPAAVGAVTGNATLNSFWFSLLNVARVKGSGKLRSFATVC